MRYICTNCSQVFNDNEKETEEIKDCPRCVEAKEDKR